MDNSDMAVFDTVDAAPKGAVVAIGNFDGVHLGHRALLSAVKQQASQRGVPSGVVTFEPHPRSLFRPDNPPFRITPPALKQRRLAQAGMDFVCALPFTWDFASLGAQAFATDLLKNALAPTRIFVGEDFRFGQLRKGTPGLLRQTGLDVATIPLVKTENGAVYSSSLIRDHLCKGAIEAANALLGYPWEIEGIVAHGNKRGRELGFPTANVALGDTLHPAYGVYASLVLIEGEDQWRIAATNIGIRPMFALETGQLEAHILDFAGDIYGKKIRVRPVLKLRGEAKFDSLDALIRQIGDDCRRTQAVLEADTGEFLALNP
jgi:riboflavin kinase/FMN adenylyltransferase